MQFLRLRIRAGPTLQAVIHNFEEEWAGRLHVRVELEAYGVESELYEGSVFRTEEDVEKAWHIYDLGSRLAIAIAQSAFTILDLRENNYEIVLKLNHLFLNSLGLNTLDERDIHLWGVLERIVVLLTRGGELTVNEVLSRHEEKLGRIHQKLAEISGISNAALYD